MAGGTAIRVEVGRCASGLVVRPVGACTLLACPAIEAFLNSQAQMPGELFFDLSQATLLDSTFAGMLVSLVRRRGDTRRAAVYLIQPSAGVLQSLQHMHVAGLFDVCGDLPEPPAQWETLAAAAPTAAEAVRSVRLAHEALIEANGRNAAAFGAIVDALKKQPEARAGG